MSAFCVALCGVIHCAAPSARLLRLLILLGLSASFSACQCGLARKFLKAKPAPVTPFLTQRQNMRPALERVPFHYVWRNFDGQVQQRVRQRHLLYIAPVELGYLQPVSKRLARWEIENGWTPRQEREMATYLYQAYVTAFARSPAPRWILTDHPGPDTLTLELALTQLNPTSVRGNAGKLAAKFTVGPLSGLLGVFTKGNIAIEGKVTLSGTGIDVFQFSDNEKDKMTLYSTRDFRPYAHAQVAIDEWAQQFERFTRTVPTEKVKESAFFTLTPW
ncbi:MAG: DUF3313 family protein [Verrucomicrobiales bacterium]|nr:DUF3313 family protein [Verrucomicrobiales bacterium]